MLITFEGIEGSGKSTQVDLLYETLTGNGYSVVKTREPGGTGFGEALRAVTLQNGLNVLPLPELLVFMAMRAQHVEEVIMPALQEGMVVLCDRFVDATYAYQGHGRAMNLGIIETLNRLVTKGIRPNLTILINLAARTGLKRKNALAVAKDRVEVEELAFHQTIQKAYLRMAREDPKRFYVVQGKDDRTVIQEAIWKKVAELLENRGV